MRRPGFTGTPIAWMTKAYPRRTSAASAGRRWSAARHRGEQGSRARSDHPSSSDLRTLGALRLHNTALTTQIAMRSAKPISSGKLRWGHTADLRMLSPSRGGCLQFFPAPVRGFALGKQTPPTIRRPVAIPAEQLKSVLPQTHESTIVLRTACRPLCQWRQLLTLCITGC
jgi:hypothetical protein